MPAAIAAAAALAVAGLLAGCSSGASGASGSSGSDGAAGGGSGSSSSGDNALVGADRLAADPLAAVRNAADNTGHSGSVKDTTTLRTVSADKRVTLHGTGGYDYTSRTGQLLVELPTGGKLTEVVTPGMVYMLNRTNAVPAGKWVKLDVRQLSDGNLVSSGATNPADAASALRGAATATRAGAERINGVPAVRFTGTLDLSKAAQATGGPSAYGLSAGARAFTDKQVPYQVWLDPHGRILRVAEVFTFARTAGSAKAADQVRVTAQSDFSGFGQPVRPAVPSDSQVYTGPPTTTKK
jgi:hypothetical protein